MNDDYEILDFADDPRKSRAEVIWTWLAGRIHDHAIMGSAQQLIGQAHAELKAQNRSDWVGGFVVGKQYRCTLESGEYVPLLYKFTYLLRSPLKRNFSTEQFENSFDNSVEFSCFLRPDETESEFIEFIRAIRAN